MKPQVFKNWKAQRIQSLRRQIYLLETHLQNYSSSVVRTQGEIKTTSLLSYLRSRLEMVASANLVKGGLELNLSDYPVIDAQQASSLSAWVASYDAVNEFSVDFVIPLFTDVLPNIESATLAFLHSERSRYVHDIVSEFQPHEHLYPYYLWSSKVIIDYTDTLLTQGTADITVLVRSDWVEEYLTNYLDLFDFSFTVLENEAGQRRIVSAYLTPANR